MKKILGVLLFILLGCLMVSPAKPVSADTTTTTVSYQVNKAGTDQPSLANSFFSGEATVTRADDGLATVTLHLVKFASFIKSFAIGDQVAKITNDTANTADFSFVVDDNFQLPVVHATMSVMNMHQKADLVFAEALYHSHPSPANSADSQTSTVGNQSQNPATTDVNKEVATSPSSSASTAIVKYQVNKAGSNTPSIANGFFTGEATVTLKAGQPQTVTLHLQKFASLIKTFTIGDQKAKMSNVTGDTADLTFTIDANFTKPVVSASMSVMNMAQKADLVFEKALYQASAPEKTASTIKKTKPTTQAQVVVKKPSLTAKSQAQSTNSAHQSGEVSAKLYQAQNGHLTSIPSAAQQFISQSAKVVRHATGTTVTLHTTGAEYIQAMRVAGHFGKITHRDGTHADLVFNLSTQTLDYALPVTFSLVVPGAGAMTQSAFLLLDLPVQAAKVAPAAKLFNTTTTAAAERPVVASPTAHAINAQLAQQVITYSVLDAGGSALSTANQYFTHAARVVKASVGYDVELTVRVAAGLVRFTPISVNGKAVSKLSHMVIGGQDVWTFAFHVANADGLDQLIPATILMSVPMANISDQVFKIEFAFARLASDHVAGVNLQTTSPASKTKALKPITITTKAAKTAGKAASTTQATSRGLKAQSVLPRLKHYPIGWEALAFILADGLILFLAWIMRRRRRLGEVSHD